MKQSEPGREILWCDGGSLEGANFWVVDTLHLEMAMMFGALPRIL